MSKRKSAKSAEKPLPWHQRVRTDRRMMLKSSVAVAAMVIAGFGIHRHDVNSRHLHDLSAIGGEAPVVVQVHDPSCSLCRKLMSATKKALESRPDIEYRIADITTTEGRQLQERHAAATVSLLMFNNEGNLVSTIQGVQTPDVLSRAFDEVFTTNIR